MKIMKKALAILMSIVMAVCIFSACGGDKKENTAITPEAVTQTCITKLKEADAKGVKDCVSTEFVAYETLEKLSDIDATIEKEKDMSTAQKETVKTAEKLIIKYLPELLKNMECSVGKAEITGDRAKLSVEVPAVLAPGYEPSEKLQKNLAGLFIKNASTLQKLGSGEFPDSKTLERIAENIVPDFIDIVKEEFESGAKGKINVELKKEGTGWKICSLDIFS